LYIGANFSQIIAICLRGRTGG